MSDSTVDVTNPGGSGGDAPQWARDAITKANNEAATYRTSLRTKTDEHTTALSQIQALTDEKAAAELATATATTELTKLRIALEAGVPGDRALSIAARLQGSTEDELKADATKLVADFGLTAASGSSPAFDPSQGRGSENPVYSANPHADALANVLSGAMPNLFNR